MTEPNRDSAMLQLIMTELANLRVEIRSNSFGVSSSVSRTVEANWTQEVTALAIQLKDLAFNVENLIKGAIPPNDFSDDLDGLDLKLETLASRPEVPIRHTENALILRRRLRNLRNQHDEYLKVSKAELE